MTTLTYTHKGWFGFCPIHIGDVMSPDPCLKARHWSLEWLLDASAWMQELAMLCVDLMGGDPPGYRIYVGQKLPTPIVVEVEA